MKKNIKNIYGVLLKWQKQNLYNITGHSNYKKFVIISTARTGSTLLATLLNSHQNIICEGEIFKNLNGKSCSKIWQEFFSKKPKKIHQVGFKLFYFHPYDEDKDVWNIINNDKTITIIHLKRKNLLRIFLSQKIGLKTKLWTDNINRPNNLSLNTKKVTLDYHACIGAFEEIEDYENITRLNFQRHNYLEVYYEDLIENRQLEINRILSSLNLPVDVLTANNKQQNPEGLNELINNYSELKIKFENSKWEYLFEE
ncbi:sulfotransferase [Christiangramia crocea]|uniref:Sulfotransferase n=1 Tax=Christiangramia crocea TaxID=2904124 RepID=A0A9X1UZA7_9FLAO|nr:sulfotransferase [Gramella crocea]MCG9973014.1 sulfotransferase [Gramella crocea]